MGQLQQFWDTKTNHLELKLERETLLLKDPDSAVPTPLFATPLISIPKHVSQICNLENFLELGWSHGGGGGVSVQEFV